jgi:hypothetical protein
MNTIRVLPLVVLLLATCSDESPTSLNDDDLLGFWVVTELKYDDGTERQANLGGASIFGAYAGGILFSEDKRYTPVSWSSPEIYTMKDDEAGSFDYVKPENQIFLSDGAWALEFEILEYDANTLVIKDRGSIGAPAKNAEYTLKREELK